MLRLLTAGGVLLISLIAADITSDAAPFVPGFERFARHTTEQDGGSLLISELSCTACHASTDASIAPKKGPDLRGAGRRLSPEWLRRFVLDPAHAKPGTTMPSMLRGLPEAERDSAADALVAFLSTQQRPYSELKSTAGNPIAVEFWRKGDEARGRQLYHTVGCVACHQADADYETGEPSASSLETLLSQLDEDDIRELGLTDAARSVKSVPLPDLARKYSQRALTHFLLNPAMDRPSGRMPSLKLTPAEATDIAAWLQRDQPVEHDSFDKPSASADVIATGRKLFTELRCANCHTADGVSQSAPARPLTELATTEQQSCLQLSSSGQPNYGLDPHQQSALRATIEQGRARQPVPEDAGQHVTLTMQQFNCFACHERASLGGVGPQRRAYFEIEGHVDLGDEGRIPPPLTGVGRKLKSAWLKKVLTGAGDVRSHMQARMPVFPAATAASLSSRFAAADGLESQPESAVFGDVKSLAAAGRELLNTGCVQCHPIRDERLPGVVGIDLNGVAARVHPQWFHDFLLNPANLKKRTRMPTFFPNGKSANQEVLDGNVERQIAAMWAYVKDAAKQPLPEKIEKGKIHNFELIPQERPVVLRTFLRDAGPHGIAVGFPQKLHLTFDAEQVRVAQLWKGRFLDAHGTWFNRFTPLAAPLGTDVVSLPAGIPFANIAESDKWPESSGESAGYLFRGYRLDESGTPEFLYRFSGLNIRDRLAPDGSSAMVRRMGLSPQKGTKPMETVSFRVLTGKTLMQQPDGSVTNEAGLSARVSGLQANDTVLQKDDVTAEWRLSVGVADEAVIEVRYQW